MMYYNMLYICASHILQHMEKYCNYCHFHILNKYIVLLYNILLYIEICPTPYEIIGRH